MISTKDLGGMAVTTIGNIELSVSFNRGCSATGGYDPRLITLSPGYKAAPVLRGGG